MRTAELFETITATIITQIEEGAATWEMPWHRITGGTATPINGITGRAYTGGNALWLWLTAEIAGYPTGRWATYKQWSAAGAQVRKGETGTRAIYWSGLPAADDDDTGQPLTSPTAAGRHPGSSPGSGPNRQTKTHRKEHQP